MRRRRVDVERGAVVVPEGTAQPKLRRGLGNRQPNEADVVAREERRQRRRKVFDLKMSGASTTAIATELKVSVRQVRRDFTRACDEVAAEDNAKLRAVASAQCDQEILRLNLAIQGVSKKAEKGDVDAAHALANLSRTKGKYVEFRAKLNGAVAPTKVQHQHEHAVTGAVGLVLTGMSDERYAGLVAAARERRRLAAIGAGSST